MTNFDYALWIPLLPFLSFLILGLSANNIKARTAGLTGVLSLGLATALSLLLAWSYFGAHGGGHEQAYATLQPLKWVWLRFTDTLPFEMGILLDPLSVMMLVVVTLVSLMVHIYSLGYMKGERGFARYYAFLSLFTFAMLGLVLANNIFQTYFFWELVGVSSFLLIGFYYDRPSAVAAAKKAFIVTRFADLGFLIGILILSYYAGTFDFGQLNAADGPILSKDWAPVFSGHSLMFWALLLIFMGAAGKSAMFPLHIWLPDAMEGPTPVSALIHAATMVVAGVYLVARLFPVYYLVDYGAALEVVAWVGAISALLAAIMAMAQMDIKRVLAYSTMSQIGYMMLALGVSDGGADGLGYTASLFHLFTHAFFKSLLFLGAGMIIHALHTNDLREMGNLRKYLPWTHWTFLIACLAISGIPPFSGFFSKDEILAAARENHFWIFAIGYFVAGLTAFYMFRLYFTIFWGRERQYSHRPHEGGWNMKLPLAFLALITLVAGFIPFGEFVSADGLPHHSALDWKLAMSSVGIALIGILAAMYLYSKYKQLPSQIARSLGPLYRLVERKFYIDEIYAFVAKRIMIDTIGAGAAWFDRHIVDGTMNLIGRTTLRLSSAIKGVQSGQVQHYALAFLGGALALAVFFFFRS
ncbi:MAG TPA: NADH-quinone oxidoreductase subunit L [Phaeodactylibacter sp.]|nr:NADH-quinone oxidoreductase subunit L [Phaeodactylibacter sp.]